MPIEHGVWTTWQAEVGWGDGADAAGAFTLRRRVEGEQISRKVFGGWAAADPQRVPTCERACATAERIARVAPSASARSPSALAPVRVTAELLANS